MDEFEFSPMYYNTVDQVYHTRWVAEKLHRIARLKELIDARWPGGHPARLVIVGGTSGKGSTVRYLEAGLALDGNTGALTSPHLFDYRERFRVGEEAPSRAQITEIWETVLLPITVDRMRIDPAHPVDYQDIAILFALHLFERHEVKWGVIETGVGGRYDKTMALEPAAACLTNIGDDHEHLLGDQPWMRALEKGGIVRPGIPLFTTERDPQLLEILAHVCAAQDSPFQPLGDEQKAVLAAALAQAGVDPAGHLLSSGHQEWNATLALETITSLAPGLDPGEVVRRFAGVQLPGRFWEVEPGLIADVAHNPNKTAALAEEIRAKYPERNVVLVAGVSGRRDPAAVLGPLLEVVRMAILTRASHKGQPPEALAQAVQGLTDGVRILVNPDPVNALRMAKAYRGEGEPIVLAGSTFLIDQALNPDPYMQHLNEHYGWRNQERPPAS